METAKRTDLPDLLEHLGYTVRRLGSRYHTTREMDSIRIKEVCSNRRYTWHHSQEECQAAADAGYPYGFGDNLTVFTGTEDAAQHALDNWINSPGHFQTMIDPACDCIGVGVTQHDGITYCFMFVGIPNSVNFYA